MPARSSGNASITYNGNLSTGMLTVTINSTGDMLEATDIGDQRKSFIAGQASTTASGEIYYDQTDNCIAGMEVDSLTPVSRTVSILMDTGMGISGTAFVTSFSATAGLNEVIRASFELQFSGTVTIT
jgi:hypothetical protein